MLRNASRLLGVVGLLVLAVAAALCSMAQVAGSFVPGLQPVGYVAQQELSGYDLRSNTVSIFRGQYDEASWSGNLLAYGMDSSGNQSQAPQLDAAARLDARTEARLLVTLKSDGSPIPFALEALSPAQQAALSRSEASAGRATSQQVLDYLRGERGLEVGASPSPGGLRKRASRLGDIVHSRPLYVGDATLANGVVKTASAALPTVFVGSNDGMLHAFDASVGTANAGRERWAYVPSMLIPRLSALADPAYAHGYYVDGSANAGFVQHGARRILVGALGAGGKGLYALDITGDAGLAPRTEAEAASHILWEVTDTGINNASDASYANLGFTYANPQLAKVKGVDAVIVGNGYLGADGRAYLYLINAMTGALLAPPIGTDNRSGNGLSTPTAVDADGDGNVDWVFAGDLLGRMWRFDVSAGSSRLLFDTAKTPPQPITAAPAVALHPEGGYMVNFATGAMLKPSDSTDATTVFAAYGIWDGAPSANTSLLVQTLATRCFAREGAVCTQSVRTLASAQKADWRPGHNLGWMTPLPAGERVLGDGSFVENGRFYFNAHNPAVVVTPVAGSLVQAGSNYLMELDYLSGGIAANQPFLDLDGDGQFSDADRLRWHGTDPPTEPATAEGRAILTRQGVPIGKFIGTGVVSQPVLLQLGSWSDTLINRNLGAEAKAALVSSEVVQLADGSRSTFRYANGYVLFQRITVDPASGTMRVTMSDNTGAVLAGASGQAADGASLRGGLEHGVQARTGRIAWRELVQP
jgi:type IV pilus assembly protein PilY1